MDLRHGPLHKHLLKKLTDVILECYEWHWIYHGKKEGKTNEELYRNLPPVSSKIQTRRMKLAGHCIRHKEEIANKLVFWKPEGKHKKGRPATNYIDKLLNDTGLNNTEELEMVIMERQAWSEYVTAAGRPDGRPK